jgi:flagellar motor switch protein FliM
VPIFCGRLGVSDGNYAIKVQEWIGHRQPTGLQDLLNEPEEQGQ